MVELVGVVEVVVGLMVVVGEVVDSGVVEDVWVVKVVVEVVGAEAVEVVEVAVVGAVISITVEDVSLSEVFSAYTTTFVVPFGIWNSSGTLTSALLAEVRFCSETPYNTKETKVGP